MTLIIYTKTGCPWCNGALSFLKEHHIEFEERNVTENPAFFVEMEEKSNQTKAPTIDFKGEILADTDDKEIEEFLKKKNLI